jgi:hypothetical protein
VTSIVLKIGKTREITIAPTANTISFAVNSRPLVLPDDAIVFMTPVEYSLDMKNPARTATPNLIT